MTSFPKNDSTAIMLASIKAAEEIDPEAWLNAWIKCRYEYGNHVPLPNYLLVSVFIEALKDYEKDRNRSGS